MTDSLPISALEFDPRNARKRTDRSAKMIGTSLEQFGPLRSLAGQQLPDGRIIVRAGNGTLEQAQQIGIDKARIVKRKRDELIVVVADDLDDQQWTQYAIADNRSSDLSEWDDVVLSDLHEEHGLDDWFDKDEVAAWGENAPSSDVWADSIGLLPTEDRAPFQQMTFTLHDEQVEQVKSALEAAKGMGEFDSENQNSNGNALARICEIFLTSYGDS